MAESSAGPRHGSTPPEWPGRVSQLPGQPIIVLSVSGTLVYAAAAAAASVAPDELGLAFAALAVTFFAVGSAAFLWAYFLAIGRSRVDLIGVGGLFFLEGCAPKKLQRVLMGALAAQVLIAFVTASIRIYTPLAFGLLVPMFGLGLAGLWGARHGWFSPRPPE